MANGKILVKLLAKRYINGDFQLCRVKTGPGKNYAPMQLRTCTAKVGYVNLLGPIRALKTAFAKWNRQPIIIASGKL